MKTLVIEKSRIKNNVAKVLTRAGRAAVYAVLKGNAYGLGLVEMAGVLRDEGISRFALTDLEDAVKLRGAGFHEEEILMLRSTPDGDFIQGLCDYNLVGTIGSYEAAVAMNGIAADRNKTVVEAHIEIDTGMGRYGFLPSDCDKVASVYRYMPNIALTGIYTHFYKAYISEHVTRLQLNAFIGIVEKLRGQGIEPGLVHAAGSSALFRYDNMELDAVRVGSALTGRLPGKLNFGLQKTGYLTEEVCETRWLPKGATIGYGAAYKTARPTKIAVIPVGFADGFCVEKEHDSYTAGEALRYALSELKKGLMRKKKYVWLNGSRARVIGHVGMLHTVVDVTKLDCSVGDRAIFDVNTMLVGDVKRVYE